MSIDGTIELKEQKSFFGSKMMVTPKSYTLDRFNEDECNFEIIEPVNSSDIKYLRKGEKTVLEESTKRDLVINVDSAVRLVREMIETGAGTEFFRIKDEGYTSFSDLSDDELTSVCRSYLNLNILNLYKISDVKLFVKDNAIEGIDPLFRVDLDNSQKINLDYKEDKNVIVDNISDFKIKIKKQLDTKVFRSYTINITLVRI